MGSQDACGSLWKTPDAFQCNHYLFPTESEVLDAKMGFFADEVGALFDPEQPNTYSRISQLIATYDFYLIKVEPESSLEFLNNIYP